MKRKLNAGRYWWIWKGKLGRGMWPLKSEVPKGAVGPFGTKREAEAFRVKIVTPRKLTLVESWATGNFKRLASEWALEGGLVRELTLGEPIPVKNTRRKRMTIHVADSKGRTAICTFKADGSRDVFERTDRISGG